MKKEEETKPRVIKSKKMFWKDKEYTEKLTSADIADMQQQADYCKLNGWGIDSYLDFLTYHVRENWKDDAVEIFNAASPELNAGLGATMNLYTDRRAMTIVEVVSPRKVVVQENETRCVDYYAGDYEVLDTFADYMSKHTFTLRKGGTWVKEGQPKKYGSVTLSVGYRRHYIDPSF